MSPYRLARCHTPACPRGEDPSWFENTSVGGGKVYCGDGDYLNFWRFESESESQQIINAAIGIYNYLPRSSLRHLRLCTFLCFLFLSFFLSSFEFEPTFFPEGFGANFYCCCARHQQHTSGEDGQTEAVANGR
jgi:hypothetical protein